MEAFTKLQQFVSNIEPEIAKAEGGNKSAGTRVRKAMQEIKQAAQKVREGILEERGTPKTLKEVDRRANELLGGSEKEADETEI